MTTARRAFTLVEILIVVLILGILAAIVLPKFTNASGDAKRSSLTSSLQALRGQVELFMLQHGDKPPLISGADWSQLTDQTTYSGKPTGPYVPNVPANPLNGFTDVALVATDVVGGDAVASPKTGFIYNSLNGKLWATNTLGDRVYNEVTPSDPNN